MSHKLGLYYVFIMCTNDVHHTAVRTAVFIDNFDGTLREPGWCRRRPVHGSTVIGDVLRSRSIEKDEKTPPTTTTHRPRALCRRQSHSDLHRLLVSWKQFSALIDLSDTKLHDVFVAVSLYRSSVEYRRRQHGQRCNIIELQPAVIIASHVPSVQCCRRRQHYDGDDQRPSLSGYRNAVSIVSSSSHYHPHFVVRVPISCLPLNGSMVGARCMAAASYSQAVHYAQLPTHYCQCTRALVRTTSRFTRTHS